MNITEVRVKMVGSQSERVRAFCSVTLDHDFVIRDLKVIEGTNGLFVAMPSRKLSDHCPKCHGKNHMRAKFCSSCGARLDENRANRDIKGRKKLHADVAHPINAECRKLLQEAVVEAFQEEFDRSKQPGYVPPKLDDVDEEQDSQDGQDSPDSQDGSGFSDLVAELQQSMGTRRRRSSERPAPAAEEPEPEKPEPQVCEPTPSTEPQATQQDQAADASRTPKPEAPAQADEPESDAEADDGFGTGIL
ncbi:MAG: SpoVG family protein [Phycisphaerae bacterium]